MALSATPAVQVAVPFKVPAGIPVTAQAELVPVPSVNFHNPAVVPSTAIVVWGVRGSKVRAMFEMRKASTLQSLSLPPALSQSSWPSRMAIVPWFSRAVLRPVSCCEISRTPSM